MRNSPEISLEWRSYGGAALAYSLHGTSGTPGSRAKVPGTGMDETFFDGNHALLRFEKPGSSLAQAQGLSDVWSFKRCGLWEPRISIRRVGKDRDLGIFARDGLDGSGGLGAWQGTLAFSQSETFRIRCCGETAGCLALWDAQDELMMQLESGAIPGHQGRVKVFSSLAPGDVFLFASFLWYLEVLAAMEAAAVSMLRHQGLVSPRQSEAVPAGQR